MRIEIPDFTRCCICIPLRYGILTFGYINLSFTLLLLAFEIYLITVYKKDEPFGEVLQASDMFMYRGVDLYSQMWFIFVMYSLEVIFNIILLVGAHMIAVTLTLFMPALSEPALYISHYHQHLRDLRICHKNVRLMKAYYYFGITTCLATFVCYVAVRNDGGWRKTIEFHIFEFCFAFSVLAVQVYLLLLIRSELKKLEVKTRLCFINHASSVYANPS